MEGQTNNKPLQAQRIQLFDGVQGCDVPPQQLPLIALSLSLSLSLLSNLEIKGGSLLLAKRS